MTTITLDVSDDLAERLAPIRERLAELLALAVELDSRNRQSIPANGGESHPLFQELLDFLATSPTPEQILTFKISAAAQARLDELLDKHREQGLTGQEAAELAMYSQINHLLILLKARVRAAVGSPN